MAANATCAFSCGVFLVIFDHIFPSVFRQIRVQFLQTIIALGKLDGAKVAFTGNCLTDRDIHSAAYAIGKVAVGSELIFISDEELAIPVGLRKHFIENQIKFSEIRNLKDVIGDIDILYIKSIQESQFPNPEASWRHVGRCSLDLHMVKQMKDGSYILDPVPRHGEICKGVDESGHAYHVEQAGYRVPVAMAMLGWLI
jgi:aspartate carbamoyltransferase catalytic subunit